MRESELQSIVLQWLNQHPEYGFFWRQNQSTTFYRPELRRMIVHRGVGYVKGVPDIVGFLPTGRFMGIEVKSLSGELSDSQVEFLSKAVKYNAEYVVIRTLDELQRRMRAICQAKSINYIQKYSPLKKLATELNQPKETEQESENTSMISQNV